MPVVGYSLEMIRYKKEPATGYSDIVYIRKAMRGKGCFPPNV